VISYGEFLWGNLNGTFLLGFQMGWAGLGWAGLGWAGLGWAGLGWAGQGWLAMDVMGFQSTIETPHKISP
jgi:hypothetical protein